MAPRLNFKCPLGPRKRNSNMHFLFLSKVQVNKTPPGTPTGLERAALLHGLFYMPLKFPIKFSINKEIFPFSQRP
jgi:hypothetical protein